MGCRERNGYGMKHELELFLGLLMIMVVVMISSNMPILLEEKHITLSDAFDENVMFAPEKENLEGETEPADAQAEPAEAWVVVLDAGHGGNDCGKIGVNGVLEKDINLQIVNYLKEFLEASGIRVVLMRSDGNGLYSEGASNKKREDMNKRCAIIEESQADLVVSIHQNSYQTADVDGAQVFYFEASEQGKELAAYIQERFDYVLGEKNDRSIKPNTTYYLLKNVKQPMVIVECGFLSNGAEAQLLSDALYQERVAWTIHMGILQYFQAFAS